ncbi:uncharacterized protein LOC127078535 [Lathyrus oleraceus]|uniref:uncharacterized protein LOC127078535 n=1 Tax=Pisum sativum TaxID=3888 RepID=UPI0021CDF8FE|nr:uncharacterized protein LOC127078535 [Pisum sativum]
MGIFDLLQLSKVGPSYCQSMLVSSLYFWDSTHHTFHLPCGMMTPTLFDISAITGLKHMGETYDPYFLSKDNIGFDTSRAAFTMHIAYYHDKDIEEVSDTEHIAFLALWLSRCVFCSKSLQVAKKFLTLSNQLHAGRNLCLSEMILANLYESLGERVTTLKNTRTKGNLIFSGPFWLLQLWLNASFEVCLPTHNPIDADAVEVRNKRVEGTRLEMLTPRNEGRNLQQSFTNYVMMFAKRYNFTPTMAPFAFRTYGPDWFTRKFPYPSKDKEAESVAIWEAFLTPRVFSLRLNQSKSQVTLIAYQPSLVARQFGIIQIFPKPLYARKNSLLLYNAIHTKATSSRKIARYAGQTKLSPFSFKPYFLCTHELDLCWCDYYATNFFNVPAFHRHLTKAFSSVQDKVKKVVRVPPKKTAPTTKRPTEARKENTDKATPTTKASRKPPLTPKKRKQKEIEVEATDSDDEDLSPDALIPIKSKKKKQLNIQGAPVHSKKINTSKKTSCPGDNWC